MTPLRQQLIRELVLRGMSSRTQEAYIAAVYGLARYYRQSPEQVTDSEIKEHLFHLHTKGRSASTVNQVTSGLKFFFRHVLDRDLEAISKAMPRVKKPISRPDVFSVEEVQRLLSVEGLNPKHRIFLMTVYSAGLRLNEACHLKVEHILGDRMQLRVVGGKGKRDRYVNLSERLLEELRAYWQLFRPRPWLFPSARYPQQPINEVTAQRIYHRAVSAAGLRRKGGIHALRHSYATHLIESGVEVNAVQRLLGHAHLNTTAIYLHVRPERLAQVKSPLDLLKFSGVTNTD